MGLSGSSLQLHPSHPPRQGHLRRQAGRDPSEAGLAVLEAQLESQEPLQSDERGAVVTVRQDMTLEALVRELSGGITGADSGR